MLEVSALDVAIAGHRVCRDLWLKLTAGSRLAILGRNGAGKSTLLSVLAGLRPQIAGEVRIAGRPVEARASHWLATRRGYLAQQPFDAFATSVLEAVLAGRHPHLSRWAWEAETDRLLARQALARVGLADFAQRDLASLSGGERQRVAFATLLTQAPDLYLLDEPLTHLDLNHQIALLDIVAELAAGGAAIVAVLHDPNLALRFFDRVLLLFGNGDWLFGSAAEILTTDHLSRLYGYPLQQGQIAGQTVFIPG